MTRPGEVDSELHTKRFTYSANDSLVQVQHFIFFKRKADGKIVSFLLMFSMSVYLSDALSYAAD